MSRQAEMETRYLDDAARQALIRRINRAGGQVNGLRKMIEEHFVFVELNVDHEKDAADWFAASAIPDT